MAYMDEQGFMPENSEDETDLYREVQAVKNGAQKKIEVEMGYPRKAELDNGSISIRYVPGQGVFLFVKFMNKLFNTRLAEEGRTGISRLIDSTGGVITDAVNDTTASQSEKDDIATLAAKLNEVIGKL
jgi:hypothetical protein